MPPKVRKSELLSALKSSGTVSGAQLARKLKISRQALHKKVNALRKQGYEISGRPKAGYKMKAARGVFIAEEVSASLSTRRLGKEIHFFETLDSTQNAVKELAAKGEAEGAVVVAARQTNGRGRMGRVWSSGEGGLWVSILLRPPIQPQGVPPLSLVASLAIADAVESVSGANCALKWPNDVWASARASGGKAKKICGILTEMSAEPDRVNWVALGIGVNVNNPLPEELKRTATTLRALSKKAVDRQALLGRILENLEKSFDVFYAGGFAPFRKKYAERCLWKRQRVTLSDFERDVEGRFLGVNEDGALVLGLPGGESRAFYAGDVSLSPIANRGTK